MKKKSVLLLVSAVAGLLLSACATSAETCTLPALEEEKTLGNNILESVMRDDSRAFLKYVGEKDGVNTEQEFKSSRENLERQFGKMSSYEFVTALETPLFSQLVWKVTFVRKDSDGKEIHQQILYKLLLGRVDGRLSVIGMGFI